MRGRCVERLEQGFEVVHLLLHRIAVPLGDRFVRPVVAPAVGNDPEPLAQRTELGLPGPVVARRAVDEHHHLPHAPSSRTHSRQLLDEHGLTGPREALKKYFQRRRGKVTYTLGHVNSAKLDSGTLVDR